MNHSFIDRLWYQQHPIRWALAPFAAIYRCIIAVRRWYLQLFKQKPCPVPLIVVGNLTVGGSGKTPLVIALAKACQVKGLRVGIVSRGYGARGHFPREVSEGDLASDVGDEPLLMANQAACPVVIAPKRNEAVEYLIRHYQPQIIISDDGLQHYAMSRSIEIAVIDGLRGLGNGFVLPAGPLREPARRLDSVDFVVVNSGEWPHAFRMNLSAGEVTQLLTGHVVKQSTLTQPVAAVAAIGNPHRFFQTLRDLQLHHSEYAFPDHYVFRPSNLIFKEKTIVMTEKDAVKCQPFATDQMYYIPVTAELSHEFWDALWRHDHLKGVVP